MDNKELGDFLVTLKLPKVHVDFFLEAFNKRGVSLLDSSSSEQRAERKELADFLKNNFPFVLKHRLKWLHHAGIFAALDKRTNSSCALYITCDIVGAAFDAERFQVALQKELDACPRDSTVVRASEFVVHKSARLGHCMWLKSELMGCSLAHVLALFDLASGDKSRDNLTAAEAAVKSRIPFVAHDIVTYTARQLTEAVHSFQRAGLPFELVRPSKVLLADSDWSRRVLNCALDHTHGFDSGAAAAPADFSAADAKAHIPSQDDEATWEDIHGHRPRSSTDLAQEQEAQQKRAVQLLSELRLEHFVGVKLGGFFNLRARIFRADMRVTTDDHFNLMYYVAPEQNGPKASVWSLGCTVHALATGEPPFMDLMPMRAWVAVQSTKQPTPQLVGERFSPQLKHFLARCFEKDETKRADTSELLRHPLLSYPLANFLRGTHAKLGANSAIRNVLIGHALGSRHVLRVLKAFLDGEPASRDSTGTAGGNCAADHKQASSSEGS